MSSYRFTGCYPTYVGLPDGSTVYADPESVHELSFDQPGPLWEPVAGAAARSKKSKGKSGGDTPADVSPASAGESTSSESISGGTE